MTRKDYILIADAIGRGLASDDPHTYILHYLVPALKQANVNFDPSRFHDYVCKVYNDEKGKS